MPCGRQVPMRVHLLRASQHNTSSRAGARFPIAAPIAVGSRRYFGEHLVAMRQQTQSAVFTCDECGRAFDQIAVVRVNQSIALDQCRTMDTFADDAIASTTPRIADAHPYLTCDQGWTMTPTTYNCSHSGTMQYQTSRPAADHANSGPLQGARSGCGARPDNRWFKRMFGRCMRLPARAGARWPSGR